MAHQTTGRHTLVVVDDHPIVAEGVRAIFEQEFDVLEVVTDGHAAFDVVTRLKPDCVVLDLAMQGISGIQIARRLSQSDPDLPIVMLTMHTERHHVAEAIAAGARGFVPKITEPPEVLHAVSEAIAGRQYIAAMLSETLSRMPANDRDELTHRQMQVLRKLAEGRSTVEIGEELGISTKTVEFHRDAIKKRLGIRSTAQLVRYAIDHGILE